MKKTLFFTSIIFCFSILFSQIPDWNWARGSGGLNNNDTGTSISVDGSGNSYVTGHFTDTAFFGTDSLIGNGNWDVFVQKIDQNGDWVWAKRAGGSDADQSLSIVTESNGDSYISGRFNGQASFGNHTLTSSGLGDVFIAKIDQNGNWLWARKGGGTYDDIGYDICLQDNYIYITGSFDGNALFGNFFLSSTIGYSNTFVIKMDLDGNWQWAKQSTVGNASVIPYSICIDENSNAYITGKYVGATTFGVHALPSSQGGSSDIYLTKIDSDGNWQWVNSAGSFNHDVPEGISVDNDGNVYVTGYYSSYCHFDLITLENEDQTFDLFVAKLNPGGNWIWARNSGGSCSDYAFDICTNKNSGASYITGYFDNSIVIGSSNLTSTGYYDIFVAEITADGTWGNTKQAGGSTYYDKGNGICLDSASNLLLTGQYFSEATFGTTILYSYQWYDIFAAKLGNVQIASQPEIIINEIMHTPATVEDSLGEYIELYNNSDQIVDINGLILKDNNTDYHQINSSRSLLIDAYSYIVLGINADSLTNGGFNCDYQYIDFYLDAEDEVILIDGLTVIDEVIYGDSLNFPDTTGASLELNPENKNIEENNDGENWYIAHQVFGDGDYGTPDQENSGLPLNIPENVIINENENSIEITWDAVPGATSYKVYSSDDPYSGFTEDTSGAFAGESWSAPAPETKQFYYVKAEN